MPKLAYSEKNANIGGKMATTFHNWATTLGCPCPTIAEHQNDANNNPVSLPYLIDRFKTGTTNKYIDGVKTFKWKPFHKRLWQRNYYERIIRDDAEYARIAEYIRNNPILWDKQTRQAH